MASNVEDQTSQTRPPARPRRRRDPESTRVALVRAARELFTQRGIDDVGVREIAQRAAADSALVNRYFGSKEGLFTEAMTGDHDSRFAQVLASPDADLPRRLVDYVLDDAKHEDGVDVLLGLLRSVNNPVAAELLRLGVDTGLIAPLRERLHPHGDRATVVAGLLMGLAVIRHVIAAPSFISTRDEVRNQAITALHRVLDTTTS